MLATDLTDLHVRALARFWASRYGQHSEGIRRACAEFLSDLIEGRPDVIRAYCEGCIDTLLPD